MTEKFANETVALYLAGALTPEEVAAFEALRDTGLGDEFAELRAMEDAVRGLLTDVPAVTPPPAIKQHLLATIRNERADDRQQATKLPGLHFRFVDDSEFQPTPYPGVSIRILHRDRSRKQFTFLMRLAPGASFPSHAHDGPEECIVLEGEIQVGGVRMRKGDYQRVEPGQDHCEQSSDSGALLYLTAPLSLLSH